MSNNWMDLKSAVDLQRQLLTAIRNNPSSSDAAISGDTVAVANINTSLGTLSTNLDNANSAIGPTLTYQKEVKQILDRENSRLISKKSAVDSAYDGQKRMIALTDGITAKNKAYNYMLFVFVLILLIFVIIKHLYAIEGIPHFILDILNVVIISLGLMYCIYLYMDIQRRYNMDFNQITLEEPVKKTPEQIQRDTDANIKSGNLYGLAKSSNTASGCKGSACCPTGTTFNEKYNVCVPNVVPIDEAPTLTSGNKGNWKYFATTDSATGVVSYAWRDATLSTTATPNPGCDTRTAGQVQTGVAANGLSNYDSSILACKVTSGFTTLSGQAKPFSADEFAEYGRV